MNETELTDSDVEVDALLPIEVLPVEGYVAKKPNEKLEVIKTSKHAGGHLAKGTQPQQRDRPRSKVRPHKFIK